MKKALCALVIATLVAVAGMATAGEEAAGAGDVVKILVCGKCGQVKGTDLCCRADALKCEKCELTKGSVGCCKLPEKGKDAELCIKCGQIKGADTCCKLPKEESPKEEAPKVEAPKKE